MICFVTGSAWSDNNNQENINENVRKRLAFLLLVNIRARKLANMLEKIILLNIKANHKTQLNTIF